jgi:hypothetical protein
MKVVARFIAARISVRAGFAPRVCGGVLGEDRVAPNAVMSATRDHGTSRVI